MDECVRGWRIDLGEWLLKTGRRIVEVVVMVVGDSNVGFESRRYTDEIERFRREGSQGRIFLVSYVDEYSYRSVSI